MAECIHEKNKTYSGNIALPTNPLIPVGERFVISYLVLSNGITDDLDTIVTATGPIVSVPAIRSPRDNAFLQRKSAREIDSSAALWQVDCHYEEHIDITSNPGTRDQKRECDYRWSAESTMEVLMKDPVTGLPIQNSVGEPFILQAPIAIPVLTVTQRRGFFESFQILQVLNKVNKEPFWGFPPKAALMADIRDEPIEVSGTMERLVTFVIKFNPKVDKGKQGETIIGWQSQLRNRGTFFFDSDGEKEKFREKFKDVLTGDLNLDGTERPGTDPLYLLFNRFPQTSFTGLHINEGNCKALPP